jgi:hypothetical protein
MLTKDIIEHIQGRIQATPVVSRPFPHLVIDEFLPPDVYAELQARWPAKEGFRANPTGMRHEFPGQTLIKTGHDDAKAYWAGVHDWAQAGNRSLFAKLAPYLGAKFAPYLGQNWRDTARGLELDARGFQLAYYSGDVLMSPHVDHAIIVTNAFLYLSESEEEEPGLGTVLYQSRGLMLPVNIDVLPSLARLGLKEAGVAAYRANRVFAYINGPASFHGVSARSIGERERRIMMFGNLMTNACMGRVLGPEFFVRGVS